MQKESGRRGREGWELYEMKSDEEFVVGILKKKKKGDGENKKKMKRRKNGTSY